MYKLVSIGSVKPAKRLSLWDVLDLMEEILRSWRVPSCVRVRDSEVVEGVEVYWALRNLGASLLPVGSETNCSVSLEKLGFFDDVSPRRDTRVYHDIRDLLRASWPTPLLQLKSYSNDTIRVWAKLEWYNPISLSIKDRTAWWILESLNEYTRIKGKVVADATSSNFGIALAALARKYGGRARIYLPKSAGQLGRKVARLMGGEVFEEGGDMTVDLIPRVVEDSKRHGYVHANQFMNDENFIAHLRFTAKEIHFQARESRLKLAGIAGSVGTSGHMAAIEFYFRSVAGGEFRVIAAQPARGDTIPGIRRTETGMVWLNLISKNIEVIDVTLEESLEAIKKVAREDGILIGPSGGAALAALEKFVGEGADTMEDYVAIIPDTGYKYLDML
ncbi:MAG: pyridoxal-phosphate dependent enzyme [Desulfurococcales archaeon]|nr:pyridoxal-phosphate dependent enzyme [Desulfurococcales archaeon]